MAPGPSSTSFGSSLPLRWNGEIAFHQVRESILADAFHYPFQPPSPRQLLRGAPSLGRSLLQGFSLVTAVAPPLLEKHLLPPKASQVRGTGASQPVVLVRSHISFHGDNFHQLHALLLKGVEDEFRRELVALHFRMLRFVLKAIHSRLNLYLKMAKRAVGVVDGSILILSIASIIQLPSIFLRLHEPWSVFRVFSLVLTSVGFLVALAMKVWLLRLGRHWKSQLLQSHR